MGDTMITLVRVRRWQKAGHTRRPPARRMLVGLAAALCGGGLALTLAVGPAGAQSVAPAPPMPGTTPGAAAASADSVNLFYTGTDRHVYWQNAVEPGQGPVDLGAR